MSIRTPNPPTGGAEVIARAIAPLLEDEVSEAIETEALWVSEADGVRQLETAAPHPVFVAGLEDVHNGTLLRSARPGGWRYLVLRGDEVVGSATIDRDERTGELSISHLTQGPYVSSTLEGIRKAESIGEVESDDFELRLLDVPALDLRALWLRAEHRDILVPLAPAPAPVEPYGEYSEENLLAAVRESALVRLGDDGDEVGG